MNYVLHSLSLKDQAEVLNLANVDKDALGLLILANETLIWHSIKKYVGEIEAITRKYSVEKDDLLQLGRLGFIKSVRAFDPERGLRFSTFAVPTITREIRCFLRDSGSVIRPTRRASEILYRTQNIERDLGFLPPVEELSLMLDTPLDAVIKALRIGRDVRYLDVAMPDSEFEGAVSFVEALRDDYCLEDEVIHKMDEGEIMTRLHRMLTDREQAILKGRLEGKTNNHIAMELGISKMKVNRILKRIGTILVNATGIRPTFAVTRKERDSKYVKHIGLISDILRANGTISTPDIRKLLRDNGLEYSLPLSTIYHIRKKAYKLLEV